MVPLFFILTVIGVVVFIIWAARTHRRRLVANLTALADRLQLELVTTKKPLVGTERRVEGTRHGKAVKFWTFSTGTGKTRRHWAAVAVQPLQAGGLTFQLETQGFGTRIAELFGAKEIQVDDARFDAAWFVRTNEPELFGAALVPAIREKLMAARESGAKGDFKLEGGWVSYAEQGNFATEATVRRLEGLLPVLFDLADAAEVCAAAGQG
ncbi:MAG: hypothetical protein Q8J74_09805 [Candidatus Didemnitutus sp.]|nr:hypothetical protein [Candidatus Didemnitutus sp.]